MVIFSLFSVGLVLHNMFVPGRIWYDFFCRVHLRRIIRTYFVKIILMGKRRVCFCSLKPTVLPCKRGVFAVQEELFCNIGTWILQSVGY